MSFSIEQLNAWGGRAAELAWPMLWQSSLLIAALFALDLVLRRKLRPAVRYSLWLLVLVKLVLPPSLALPSGLGWWVRRQAQTAVKPRPSPVLITYGLVQPSPLPSAPIASLTVPPRARLSFAAAALVLSTGVSLSLVLVLILRWRKVAQDIRRAAPAPDWLTELLPERPAKVTLRMTDRPLCPAVCGLFRPVILLPRTLADRLHPPQLRAVLMHELIHLRRGDVWVNWAQALLQILYWWHPLLWLANIRIRALREEAVDDAVMVALRHEADGYAPTLVQVARLAWQRPLAALGLVGILESHRGLRRRIERLLDFTPPARSGLTLASVLSVLAFAALALPMGESPVPEPQSPEPTTPALAADLLQDGKLLFEMGKLNPAEAKLKSALLQFTMSQDPRTGAARYYLNLVREQRYHDDLVRNSPPQPNLYARTNLIHTSQGRQALMSKLEHIRLDTVSFDNLPLSEVVSFLRRETINRDPEHKGINFVLSPQTGAPASATIDPTTGLPQLQPPSASTLADIAGVPITMKYPMSDLRVLDVLDAIVKVAGQRIRFSLEDYGVVFSMRAGSEPPPLYTRVFKVDPNTFLQGLEAVRGLDFGAQIQSTAGGSGGGGSGAQGSQGGVLLIPRVNAAGGGPSAQGAAGQSRQGGADVTPTNANPFIAMRDFFGTLGVNFVPGDGRTMFYSQNGGLMVRASLAELDTIGTALQALQGTPKSPTPAPQLYTRVFKIDPNTFLNGLEKVTGLSLHSLAADANARPSGAQDATAANGTKSSSQLQAVIRDYFTSLGLDLAPPKVVFYNHREGNLITRATLQDLDRLEQAVMVLNYTPPQLNLKAKFITVPETESATFWNTHLPGKKPATGPWTASLSDAEARDQLARWKTSPGAVLLNEFSVTTLSGRQTSISATELHTVSVSTNANGGLQTNQVTIGPILDLLPVVQEDMKIQLKLAPTLWEWVGDETLTVSDENAQPAAPSSPRLRKRQMTATATLWDGQTLILGGPVDDNGQPAERSGDNRLLVLVTATLIDPAGNRYRPDDEKEAIRNGSRTKIPAGPARRRDTSAPASSEKN